MQEARTGDTSPEKQPSPAAGAGEEGESQWECNICFEALRIEESCLTTCGHLYCWPCLHRWMDTFRDKTSPPVCPVCKAVLNSERIIPIFGRGPPSASDPRVRERDAPQRPQPQREEAPQRPRGAFDLPFFSAGIFGPGFVAFGGNWGGAPGPQMPELTEEQRRQQQFLTQIMLFIGFAVLAGVLLA